MAKRSVLLLSALLLTALACSEPTYTPSAPQATAGALNATYQTEATQTWALKATGSPSSPDTISTPGETSTPTPSPRPSPTPGPTVTPSPTMTSSIIEVTPCGAYICETADNQSDIDILARLCVVEVRGYGSRRDDACVSVVSTVINRMWAREYSDGTIRGTITWGCTPEEGCTQFPGHVVYGCQGILPQACAWNYPADIEHFRGVVDTYLRGHWGPGQWCSGFIYYGSRQLDMHADACVITGDNGDREAFYN